MEDNSSAANGDRSLQPQVTSVPQVSLEDNSSAANSDRSLQPKGTSVPQLALEKNSSAADGDRVIVCVIPLLLLPGKNDDSCRGSRILATDFVLSLEALSKNASPRLYAPK